MALIRHQVYLHLVHALRWHSLELVKVIVSYSKKPLSVPVLPGSNFQNCKIAKLKMPPSLNPHSSSS
ncbi:MAG: hypothetical protein WAM09_17985, partial [Anaerolineales bacterium]